ncbi:MAG: hypothetical protein E8A46_08280 [Bradyrhizobium sp.]|jgi:hypothetical protein|uniref:hypothetical protein n=1 Tax=Bradyrhizobium sp. TaxID=376 RepID=UPI00122622CC|nr:hypothetical protein [Bradyrhizobium sp.]THD54580.1 MAG: hypothetical protein E8A46_08280 [Bradyrhizobium sp.]
MTSSLARKPELARNHGDDARAEELEHLKLALATFALQLDAFEMRTHGLLLAAGKPGNPVPAPDRGRGPRKDDLIGGQ